MRILFVHQNFPGQYKHLAPALARRGHEAVALYLSDTAAAMPGVRGVRYKLPQGSTKGVHRFASEFETKAIRGDGVMNACVALARSGFVPDTICAHPGWGEALFVKDVFPDARLINYHEFYYKARGLDVAFDPEFSFGGPADLARLRAKNAHTLLSLEASDCVLSPTRWQADTIPSVFRDRAVVLHDGVDTDRLRPDPAAFIELPDGRRLTAADEVVTYLARNLEPYRGFHSFMRALPHLQRMRPNAQVVIVGGDGVSYGRARDDGKSWRTALLEELAGRLDMGRIHFLGKVPYDSFVRLVQTSKAHVYLTYPFVLSWSLLEAMSAGALIVGSATPPVQEAVEDGVNGRLVDFFQPEAIAATIADSLARQDELVPLREAARRTVCDRYDLLRHCLPRHVGLVETGHAEPVDLSA